MRGCGSVWWRRVGGGWSISPWRVRAAPSSTPSNPSSNPPTRREHESHGGRERRVSAGEVSRPATSATQSMTTVHQFLPTWEPGAVGAHALAVRQALLDIGVRSEIFADDRKGGLPVEAHDFRAYGTSFEASADDVLMYHVAIGSEVAAVVAARPH